MPSNAIPVSPFGEKLPSFVILKRDQTAVEIRYSKETGRVQLTQKKWYLFPNAGQEDLVIGRYARPVEVSGSVVKLINDDVGQYYEKVR